MKELVEVMGVNEDIAVIVNGECRVIRKGKRTLVEKRFADLYLRSVKPCSVWGNDKEETK